MKKFFSSRPSTAHAMSLFTNALTELDAVIANENAEVDRLDNQIAALVDEQSAAKERVSEADRAAKRVRKLVG